MRIGIPKEIKPLEGRVALVPEAVGELVNAGHEVLVQAGAGELSGYPDSAYTAHGARILPDAAALYGQARLLVKVKEPVAPEYDLLRPDHVVFSYLHLAATPQLARVLRQKGLTAVAFETRGGRASAAAGADERHRRAALGADRHPPAACTARRTRAHARRPAGGRARAGGRAGRG